MPGLDDLASRFGQYLTSSPPPTPDMSAQMHVPWNQQIADIAPMAGAALMAPTLPAALAAVPVYNYLQRNQLNPTAKPISDTAGIISQLMLAGGGKPLELTPAIREFLANTKVVGKGGNPARVYHGTPNQFEQPDIQFSHEGLYGPGYYTTTDPSVASTPGYAGAQYIPPKQLTDIIRIGGPGRSLDELTKAGHKIIKTWMSPSADMPGSQTQWAEIVTKELPSKQPQVRPEYLNIKNPLDMDKPVPKDLMANAEALDPDMPNHAELERDLRLQKYKDSPKEVTSGDLHRAIRLQNEGNGWDTNDWFFANGYDGFVHQGGQLRGTNPHRVWVSLEPNKQVVGAFQKEPPK